MDIVRILVGVALLILGRRLFWLFVGLVGFVAGITLATQFLSGQPDWLVLVIALVAGLLGVLLALFLQQLAVGVAGFVAGGYIIVNLLSMLMAETDQLLYWLIFLIGGIIGAVLVILLFDWALIVLSSLTGATLIVQAAGLNPTLTLVLFVVLLVVGFVIQASSMTEREQPPPAPRAEA